MHIIIFAMFAYTKFYDLIMRHNITIDNIINFSKRILIDKSKNFLSNIDIINKLFLILFSIFQNMKFINSINLLIDNIFQNSIIFKYCIIVLLILSFISLSY